MEKTINGENVITISGNILYDAKTKVLCDTEFGVYWFPEYIIKDNDNGTVLIQKDFCLRRFKNIDFFIDY